MILRLKNNLGTKIAKKPEGMEVDRDKKENRANGGEKRADGIATVSKAPLKARNI